MADTAILYKKGNVTVADYHAICGASITAPA